MSSNYVIEERVIERAMATYPDIPEIVPSSTPVVSFGYPNKAIVATLGINPSSNEFQVGNGNKNLLGFGSKELVDTEVLGVESPKHLNREQAIEVIKIVQIFKSKLLNEKKIEMIFNLNAESLEYIEDLQSLEYKEYIVKLSSIIYDEHFGGNKLEGIIDNKEICKIQVNIV